MRVMLSGPLWVALLWPAMVTAGGAEPAYGLGEPEPLDSLVVAAPETTAAAIVESAIPAPPPAVPHATAPQPFRIRLAGTPVLVARDATPHTSGLRYQPSTIPR